MSDNFGVLVEDIELQPINDHENSSWGCELGDNNHLTSHDAVVAVTTTNPDDPRIFYICADHTLSAIAEFLS